VGGEARGFQRERRKKKAITVPGEFSPARKQESREPGGENLVGEEGNLKKRT